LTFIKPAAVGPIYDARLRLPQRPRRIGSHMKRVLNESTFGLLALACAVMVFVAATLDLARQDERPAQGAPIAGQR